MVQDVVACRSDTAIELFRAGQLVASAPVGRLTSTEGVLWAVELGSVHRWEPTDAGLNASLLVLDLSQSMPTVLGTRPNEIMLAWPNKELFAVRSSATGLVVTPLDYETDSRMVEGLVATDGGVVWLTSTDLCFAAPSEPKRCRAWTSRMIAVEEDTLWVHEGSANELGVARFADGPTPVALQFFRPDPRVKNRLQFARSGIPSSRLNEHLVVIDPEAMRLDAWQGPPGWTTGGASSRHVFFAIGDEYVVYAR